MDNQNQQNNPVNPIEPPKQNSGDFNIPVNSNQAINNNPAQAQPAIPATPITPPLSSVETQPAVFHNENFVSANPPANQTPATSTTSQPGPFVSIVDPSPATGHSPEKPKGSSKFKKYKFLIVTGIILLILVGGASAFYFGYWMNPSVIWSNSLTNTGKGYNNLISYLDKQSSTSYKGFNTTATLSVKTNGATYSGSFNEENNSVNSQSTLKLGLGIANITVQSISYKAPGNSTPDIYLNVSGFKGLGLGTETGLNNTQLSSLDGQWISVDHTLIEQVEKSVIKTQPASSKLTWPEVVASIKDLNTVNSQYVFTTNKSKSVTTIVKKYGFETINGVKTYHYKIGFVKANVKSYITALKNAIATTPVGKYLTTATGKSIDDVIGYSSLESSADSINSSDSVDVWSGVNSRVIYKVRVSDSTNPSTSYVDYGLNYKNSTSYPFFINIHDFSGGNNLNAAALLTLNTNNSSLTGTLNATEPSSKLTVTANLTAQPTNQIYPITPPKNSITLQQALVKLGLSSEYSALLQEITGAQQTQSPASSAANNVNLLNTLGSSPASST